MKKKAFKAALPYTLPICAGFLFLGMSYGFLMRSKGVSFFYPLLMSLFIFAGSMEFVTVNLLLSAFQPLHAFFLALMVNARHLFYGISMLEKYMFFVTLLNHIYWVSGVVLGTMVTRFLPFLIFPEGKTPPPFITYLGTVLPYAVIGLLVVYCLKDAVFSSFHGLPEAIAVLFIVGIHKWKKNTLFSIGAGTVLYMVLVQTCFR